MPTYTSPVGTKNERASGVIWPGRWFDATGYARTYRLGSGNAVHTGADLNLNYPGWDSDRHAPVYAIADGEVLTANVFKGWDKLVVIRHQPLPDGRAVYARYAHLGQMLVSKGQQVRQGQQLGTVGNAGGRFPYHLHFDISATDILARYPAHWPGLNLGAVLQHYVDPKSFLILQTVPPDTTRPTTGIDPRWRGVHTSAGGWSPTEQELELVRRNQVRWAFIAAYEDGQEGALQKLRSAGVHKFVFRATVHGLPPRNPADFVAQVKDRLLAYANALGGSQAMMIQLHNEPNLVKEGLGQVWNTGREYGEWHRAAAAILRTLLPRCLISLAPMSPGGDVRDVRMDEAKFWESIAPSVRNSSDFHAVHYYWTRDDGGDIAVPIAQWQRRFSGGTVQKDIIATEVGPADATYGTGEAYRRAYEQFAAARVPMAAWVLSGAGAWRNAGWLENNITVLP